MVKMNGPSHALSYPNGYQPQINYPTNSLPNLHNNNDYPQDFPPQYGIVINQNLITPPEKIVAAITEKVIYEANNSPGNQEKKKEISFLIWKMRRMVGLCSAPENDPDDIEPDLYEGMKGLAMLAAGIKDQELKRSALNSLIEIFEKLRGDLSIARPIAASLVEVAAILVDTWSDTQSIQSNNVDVQAKMLFVLGEFADIFIRYSDSKDPETQTSVVSAISEDFKKSIQSTVWGISGLNVANNPELTVAAEYAQSGLAILHSDSKILIKLASKLDNLLAITVALYNHQYSPIRENFIAFVKDLTDNMVASWYPYAFLIRGLETATLQDYENDKSGFNPHLSPAKKALNTYCHFEKTVRDEAMKNWQLLAIAIKSTAEIALKTSSLEIGQRARKLLEELKEASKELTPREQQALFHVKRFLMGRPKNKGQIISEKSQLMIMALNYEFRIAQEFHNKKRTDDCTETEESVRKKARKSIMHSYSTLFDDKSSSKFIINRFKNLNLIQTFVGKAPILHEKNLKDWKEEKENYAFNPPLNTANLKPYNPFDPPQPRSRMSSPIPSPLSSPMPSPFPSPPSSPTQSRMTQDDIIRMLNNDPRIIESLANFHALNRRNNEDDDEGADELGFYKLNHPKTILQAQEPTEMTNPRAVYKGPYQEHQFVQIPNVPSIRKR